MFTLVKLSDIIRLDTDTFNISSEKALSQEINAKYANRLIKDVGLCIVLFDIESATDGMLQHGDGAIYVRTVFRIVVFKPFVGEILVGWITSGTADGISVRMEFLDDVFIPKSMLFEDCRFRQEDQTWLWEPDSTTLFFDTNEKIRFRVEQCAFEANGMKITGSCQTDGTGVATWWE